MMFQGMVGKQSTIHPLLEGVGGVHTAARIDTSKCAYHEASIVISGVARDIGSEVAEKGAAVVTSHWQKSVAIDVSHGRRAAAAVSYRLGRREGLGCVLVRE